MADVIEIGAEVRERELRLTSIPMMPSGGRNHLRIRIAFDAEWDGTTKTLVAYRDLSHPYHVPLGLDGTALIPHEVLAEQGVVYLGVFGIAGDQRLTSTIVRYGVNEGSLTEGLQPSDPTPEMWDQLISAVNEVRQAAESAMRDAQTAAQGAQQSEQATAGSATQADGAATRAETAADTAATSAQAAETAKTDAQDAQRAAAQSAADAQKSAARAEQAAGNLSAAVTQAQDAAQAAQQSATQAQDHAKSAGDSAASAAQAQQGATDAETTARQSAAQAQSAQETATQAATEAGESARQAAGAQTAAQNSAQSAGQQATAAATSAQQAKQSQTAAAGSATGAQASAAESIRQATAAEGAAVRAESAANGVEQSAQQIAGAIDRLVIHETAAGNPVVIRDGADWQMEGLRVYGQSEQVTTTGAQLLDPSKCTAGPNAYGLDITMDGYRVTIKGTSTHVHTDISFVIVQYADTSLSGKGYKIKAFNAVGTAIKKIYGLRTTDEKDIAIVIDTSRNTNVNMSFDIMVLETDATAFEPYTGGKPAPSPEYPQEIVSKTVTEISVTGNGNAQTVTLSAPVTLRGVPVTSGGNVTINGQRYMADLITEREGVVGVERRIADADLKRLAYFKSKRLASVGGHYFISRIATPIAFGGLNVGTMCNILPCKNPYDNAGDKIWAYTAGASNEVRLGLVDQSIDTKEKLLELLNGLPEAYAIFAVANTEFDPLPEPDQRAIRSLRTYHGNTVVTTGAHTEVDYIADPKLYIDGVVGTINDIKSKIIELESKV